MSSLPKSGALDFYCNDRRTLNQEVLGQKSTIVCHLLWMCSLWLMVPLSEWCKYTFYSQASFTSSSGECSRIQRLS